MSVRLSLAVDGGLPVAPHSTVRVYNPPSSYDLSTLSDFSVSIVQPVLPDHAAWVSRGYKVDATCPSDKVDCAVVVLPRSRIYAQELVHAAVTTAGQLVVVDGNKSDGVDSMYKALRQHGRVSSAFAKAHGKLFWFDPADLVDALTMWAPVCQEHAGYHTCAGIFSADGPDAASTLLLSALPKPLGRTVLDLGAGWGYLSGELLKSRADIVELHMLEADARAMSCARENVADPRTHFHWADAREWRAPMPFDTVVMNPPFHTGRAATPNLGQEFIKSAARALRSAGTLWLVANRHLPYEQTLHDTFATVSETAGDSRFKVIRASTPKKARLR